MVIFMEKERFDSLSSKDVAKIIKKNTGSNKYKKLMDYYIGKHKILETTKKRGSVPNNKLVNNIPRYITDTANGHFLGKPVVYGSVNEEFMAEIQSIFDYNDEQDHNMELGKGMSIYGSIFEMMYMDEDARIRFTIINPDSLIMIKSTTLKEVLGAIRLIDSEDKNGKKYKKVEFWKPYSLMLFNYRGGKLEFVEEYEHYFGDVPFTEYINNEERLGDFEGVITLVDAYNTVQSNTANMFAYNDEALLKIRKMGNVTAKQIEEMKKAQAIILENDGDIDWLLKVVDDTAMENYKKRLRDDIHIFANVPNMTDESFGGNLSGVAVSYKLWGLEQTTAIKERKFKKGLQRRIELITNILNIKGGNYNYMDIEISFRRNKPQNILEIAQIMTMLSSELSKETRLKMLPIIEDVSLEMQKLEEENKEVSERHGGNDMFLNAIEMEHKHEE